MKKNYLIFSIIFFIFLFFSINSLALIPGDFGSAGGGPPDGVVDFEDLMIFAMAYGSIPGDANWNPLCDIAGQGSTTPDGVVDFEDLMIFAMHYGEFLVHNLTKDTYYNTIQAALDDADSGDTIEVNDGTYDESITFPSGKVIILQSVNGSSSTIIRGNDGSDTVTFDGFLTGTILEGFTITHTEGLTGRGVYIVNGNLTINECTISGNTTTFAGAGINNYGTLTIAGSNISGNTGNVGAGIYNYSNGNLTITGSDISTNTATNGGGIYNYEGTITITSSTTISGNTATGFGGGGIYNSGGTITITSSTISSNIAYNSGGGIYNYDGTLAITSSDISSNNASQQGGGIYLGGTGTITIGGSDASDTSNFNAFTYNKKNGIISADQHIRNSSGDCRSSYPNNYYNPN